MRFLGIDTAGPLAQLAYSPCDGAMLREAWLHENHLSRELAPRVEALLELNGGTFSAVDALAVHTGPGSFTGLRIGVTMAKSLAWSRNIPVFGLSSLELLLEAAEEGMIAAVTPAHAGYYGVVRGVRESGRPARRRSAEIAITREELLGWLDRSSDGEQWVTHPNTEWPECVSRQPIRVEIGIDVLIDSARARMVLAPHGDGVHGLAPNYLRPSTAEARRAG